MKKEYPELRKIWDAKPTTREWNLKCQFEEWRTYSHSFLIFSFGVRKKYQKKWLWKAFIPINVVKRGETKA
jgi:hypothetical protein